MASVWRIGVRDEFAAAHALRNYKGKCEHLHGHNFSVEVVLESTTLDPSIEYVLDFTIVKKKLKDIIKTLDHKVLNDEPQFSVRNPTSENIARYIYRAMKEALREYTTVSVHQVIVGERSTQYALYME